MSLLHDIEARVKREGPVTQQWDLIRSPLCRHGCLDAFPGDTDIQKLQAWAQSRGLLIDLGFEFGGFSNVLRTVTFSDAYGPGPAGAAEPQLHPVASAVLQGADPGQEYPALQCAEHDNLAWNSALQSEEAEAQGWETLSRNADCSVVGSTGGPSSLSKVAEAAVTVDYQGSTEMLATAQCELTPPQDATQAEGREVTSGLAPEQILAPHPGQRVTVLPSSTEEVVSARHAEPLAPSPIRLTLALPSDQPERAGLRFARGVCRLMVAKGMQAVQRVTRSLKQIMEGGLKRILDRQESRAMQPSSHATVWSRIHLGATGISTKPRHWSETWIYGIGSRTGRVLILARLRELQECAAERVSQSQAYHVLLELGRCMARYMPTKGWKGRKLPAREACNVENASASSEGGGMISDVCDWAQPQLPTNSQEEGVQLADAQAAVPVACFSEGTGFEQSSVDANIFLDLPGTPDEARELRSASFDNCGTDDDARDDTAPTPVPEVEPEARYNSTVVKRNTGKGGRRKTVSDFGNKRTKRSAPRSRRTASRKVQQAVAQAESGEALTLGSFKSSAPLTPGTIEELPDPEMPQPNLPENAGKPACAEQGNPDPVIAGSCELSPPLESVDAQEAPENSDRPNDQANKVAGADDGLDTLQAKSKSVKLESGRRGATRTVKGAEKRPPKRPTSRSRTPFPRQVRSNLKSGAEPSTSVPTAAECAQAAERRGRKSARKLTAPGLQSQAAPNVDNRAPQRAK